LADDPAGLAFRELILLPDPLDSLPATFGAYKFPEEMSFNTCFSSDRSATNLFRRAFSFSRSFIRRHDQDQPTILLAPAVKTLLRDARLPARKLG
jgi:hypothetical protein